MDILWPPGNPDHYQALLVLSGGRLLGLHHEGVHPAADVPRGKAHLGIEKMRRLSGGNLGQGLLIEEYDYSTCCC